MPADRHLSVSQFKPNPLYAGDEATEDYESSDSYSDVEEVLGFEPTSEETLDPSSLRANQSFVNQESLSYFAGRGSEPIDVVRTGGEDWIWDGNHRAASAVELRYPSIRARVMDVDAAWQ